MNTETEKKPLRILQTDYFYQKYLDSFYAERPDLHLRSSGEQLRELLRDGFSTIHTLTPYLEKYGCESEFIVTNCAPIYRAWARENGVSLPENGCEEEALRQRIEHFRPDVLYIGNSDQFNNRFIRKLSFRPGLVLTWRAADIPFQTDWAEYDVVLTGLSGIERLAVSLGAKGAERFVPGIPAWVRREIEPVRQDTDVVFVGGVFALQHAKRLDMLEALAKAATEYGFSLALHLLCDPSLIRPAMLPYVKEPLFGIAMHKALRRGKIVFNMSGSVSLIRSDGSRHLDLAEGDAMSMRLFEGTAGGSLVLTDALANISRLFKPGVEIETFADEKELIEKTLYYLAHDEERNVIAGNGEKKCLETWNMENAADSFMKIVHKWIG